MLIVLLVVAFIFRTPLLQAAGNFLIQEDEPENVDAIFVLGGNTFDRCNYAVELYDKGYSELIVTMGANSPQVLESLGMPPMVDALIGQEQILGGGVPLENIDPLQEGTSTMEESNSILSYSKAHEFKKIMIISDKFHLRRVRMVFEDKFVEDGIEVVFCGAPNSHYKEDAWWQSEIGLIMVNNEYVKLLYYKMKY